jgi:hypothetical protein
LRVATETGQRVFYRSVLFSLVSATEGVPGEEAVVDDDPAAPAGWYPDPRGGGDQFYWDGAKWTGAVKGSDSTAGQAGGQTDRATTAVIAGGIALAVSPFLPWVKVILLGNLSLFQLFEAAGHSATLAWAAVIAGGSTAIATYRTGELSTIRRAGLIVGALGGILSLYALVGLRNSLEDVHGLAAVGIGPYVAVAGCLAMVIGALKAKRARSASTAESG